MDWLHFLRIINPHRASAKKDNKMKKVLSIFLALQFVMQLSAATFYTVSPSGHTLFCTTTNDGGVKVANAYQSIISGTLIIPESVVYLGSNYPVTSIAAGGFNIYDGGFSAQTQLNSIILPNK